MQADLKSGGYPTQPGVPEDRFDLWGRAPAEPIFELRAVYLHYSYSFVLAFVGVPM